MAITIYKKGEWQQYKTDNPNNVITWKGIGQKVKGSLLTWARRFRTYTTKVGPRFVGKGTPYSKTYRHYNRYSTGTKPKEPYNRFDRPTVPVSLNTASKRPPNQTQSGVTGGSYDPSGIRSGQGGTTQTFVKQYPSPSGVMFGGIVVGPRGKAKARRRYK